jgi:hypothetical protein
MYKIFCELLTDLGVEMGVVFENNYYVIIIVVQYINIYKRFP